MRTFENVNYAWGALLVEELIRLGADYFCVAPGSRSSPLAVSIGRHKKASVFVHFDERGLAFHAMGYAAATGKPAVLVCTSGTAVANFLPAVVEASKKKLPLIVITADRPPELRQAGAVQTIDQVGIFGKYATWAVDMPCPDLNIKPEYVLTSVDQAYHQAVSKRSVVHINAMFREPLTPVLQKTDWNLYCKGLKVWFGSNQPFTRYIKSQTSLSKSQLETAAENIDQIKSGIIVVGKIDGDKTRAAVLTLAHRLGWPVFADISSGLRLGHQDRHLISYFDQILLRGLPGKVDGVLHLGGRMTSKRYYECMEKMAPEHYIMVLNHGLRSDPNHQVSLRVEAGVEVFCKGVLPLIKSRSSTLLLKTLSKKNLSIDRAIEKFLNSDERLNEPRAARLISQLLPKASGLYVSNSMPLRDMDMYADPKGHSVHVCGNRGASGIDGLIASSIGYAQGLKRPVTLMVGDLAALHDHNSLAMLKDSCYPVIIVVLNNGGGGIFSFLPISAETDVFEKFYGTPHPFTFANAAAMFELNYAQPQSKDAFIRAYKSAFKSGTSTIIEIFSNREENFKIHKLLQSNIL